MLTPLVVQQRSDDTLRCGMGGIANVTVNELPVNVLALRIAWRFEIVFEREH